MTYAIALGPEITLPVDDIGEALAGSSLHQEVIIDTVTGLRRYKRRARLPWFVGNQLTMLIPFEDGRVYQPAPDILVHATLGEKPRAVLNLLLTGPRALIVEIASPATGVAAEQHDLTSVVPWAKPRSYAACGIPEYLVFDPRGDFVPEQVRAWRLGPASVYAPWEPDANGRWASALGIAFAPEGRWLRVYDPDGQMVPSNDLMDRVVAERDGRIAALEAELRQLRGEGR